MYPENCVRAAPVYADARTTAAPVSKLSILFSRLADLEDLAASVRVSSSEIEDRLIEPTPREDLKAGDKGPSGVFNRILDSLDRTLAALRIAQDANIRVINETSA